MKIKLTEGELRRLVESTTKRVLKEYSFDESIDQSEDDVNKPYLSYVERMSEDAPENVEDVDDFWGPPVKINLLDILNRFITGGKLYNDALGSLTHLMDLNGDPRYPACCIWDGWKFDFSKWAKKYLVQQPGGTCTLYSFNEEAIRLGVYGRIYRIEEVSE